MRLRTRLATFLALGLVPQPALAQASWQLLARVAGHVVHIDAAATVRRADTLAVRLRWQEPGGTPDMQLVIVERTEVHCPSLRTRVLESREFLGDVPGEGHVRPAAPSSNQWVRYSAGSLGGEIVTAVCRRYAEGRTERAGV